MKSLSRFDPMSVLMSERMSMAMGEVADGTGSPAPATEEWRISRGARGWSHLQGEVESLNRHSH